MALQKTTVTDHGFEAVNAYHRVENIFFVNKMQMSFCVRSYKTPSNSSFAENTYIAPYVVDGENPYKQAYKFVKATEQFSEAVDC
jgi:hypothetical protein